MTAVEGEDRGVEFGHDRGEQRAGFDLRQSLPLQPLGQGIHLAQHLPEAIVAVLAAGTGREVAFAEALQQAGGRAQRPEHAAAQAGQRKGAPRDERDQRG